MKGKALEIWVGLLVAITIAALLVLALQVSGLGQWYRSGEQFKLIAPFSHIGGLKTRAKVTISGVTIGRVGKIVLERNHYGEYNAMVEMVIDLEYAKIPDDSSAKILTAGLLGDNYIGLVPGQSDAYFKSGDKVDMTAQALLLEDLISKFAVGNGGQG